jgi:hypothetical protein
MKFSALATGLCSIFLLSPLSAQEPAPPPCGSPVSVPSKPALEDYPDYSDFLLQVMQYKQANRSRAAHQAACPQDYQPEPVTSSDPTVIEQPETLDSALARTERLSPIDYQRNRTWYDRSTSQSFGLPALPGNSLSGEHIRTLLGNAGSDTPLVLPMTIVGMQLDGLNDGGDARNLLTEQLYRNLFNEERKADLATLLASNPNAIVEISRNGNLVLYLDLNDEAVLTTGIIEVESCLSSGCDSSP